MKEKIYIVSVSQKATSIDKMKLVAFLFLAWLMAINTLIPNQQHILSIL